MSRQPDAEPAFDGGLPSRSSAVPTKKSLPFSDDEYRERLRRVCLALSDRGLDALIAFGIQLTLPGHVTWLAGSEPRLGLTVGSIAVVVADQPDSLVVLTLGRVPPNDVWVDDVRYGYDFLPLLQDALPARVRRVGIAGWEMFPTSVYVGLAKAYPDTTFEPASDLLLELRQVKSAAEVAVLRTASTIAQAAVQAMYSRVRPGIRERDLLAAYEQAVRAAGSDELPYATQVAGGPRTAQVTAHATDRRIEVGDFVRSDSGALYQGYCSDVSRGTYVGEPSGQARAMLDAVAEVYESGLAMIRPGVHFDELEAAAKRTAARYGLVDYLGTMIVHGIGCNQDEYPHWSTSYARPSRWVRGPGQVETDTGFVEGMVCCYEPGIYVPEVGGIRLEEPFVVTRNGIERLAPSLPIRLWVASPGDSR